HSPLVQSPSTNLLHLPSFARVPPRGAAFAASSWRTPLPPRRAICWPSRRSPSRFRPDRSVMFPTATPPDALRNRNRCHSCIGTQPATNIRPLVRLVSPHFAAAHTPSPLAARGSSPSDTHPSAPASGTNPPRPHPPAASTAA